MKSNAAYAKITSPRFFRWMGTFACSAGKTKLTRMFEAKKQLREKKKASDTVKAWSYLFQIQIKNMCEADMFIAVAVGVGFAFMGLAVWSARRTMGNKKQKSSDDGEKGAELVQGLGSGEKA